jgi:hypothetical protein
MGYDKMEDKKTNNNLSKTKTKLIHKERVFTFWKKEVYVFGENEVIQDQEHLSSI